MSDLIDIMVEAKQEIPSWVDDVKRESRGGNRPGLGRGGRGGNKPRGNSRSGNPSNASTDYRKDIQVQSSPGIQTKRNDFSTKPSSGSWWEQSQ